MRSETVQCGLPTAATALEHGHLVIEALSVYADAEAWMFRSRKLVDEQMQAPVDVCVFSGRADAHRLRHRSLPHRNCAARRKVFDAVEVRSIFRAAGAALT